MMMQFWFIYLNCKREFRVASRSNGFKEWAKNYKGNCMYQNKNIFFFLIFIKVWKEILLYLYIYIFFLFFAFNSRLVQEIYLTGTGSIVSFHCSAPRHCQLTLCVFFRCSRVFAIRPETRKLRQTLLRVNSIEAFD